jgi:WD40 repeat protein
MVLAVPVMSIPTASAAVDMINGSREIMAFCATTTQTHGNRILDAKCSPDGEQLATAAADNTVIIWNVHVI